jgi:large subunit ribosomal protein L25
MEALLEAVVRDTFGKNEARRTRREGRVPAVVYGATTQGGSREATAIAVTPKALLKILHSESGANTLISLRLDGVDAKVLVKEYQLDPITHQILHADFYRVAMDRMLQITIPVVVKGEPRGVKVQGGLLEFVRREIEVECLPGDIPEHIAVDVSELMLHDGVRVRDVESGGKWKALSDADMLIVHLVAPKTEVEPVAADAAATPAAAEPEVMKKGKVETEEEAADAKPVKKEKEKEK